MCIIIDSNCLDSVFKESCPTHPNFRCIKLWINEGKGKLIYGGKKYKKELVASGYAPYVLELRKQGKAILLNEREVDSYEKTASNSHQHRDFDDPHLIAMIQVSKCKIIATKERRAIPFIQNKNLYTAGVKPPKIFSGTKQNKSLINDRNMVNICKQC